jgi:tripartite-type tricarboxylate transporter receptor subunit TctC
MATSGPITVAPSLMPSLPYDPRTDLMPVTYLVNMPNALFAAGDVGNDLPAVLAAGRAAPGRISFGYPGSGSQGHLALALMSQATGTEWLGVSYRGASLVLNDMGRRHGVAHLHDLRDRARSDRGRAGAADRGGCRDAHRLHAERARPSRSWASPPWKSRSGPA